jgi:methionyl aminopeptidase
MAVRRKTKAEIEKMRAAGRVLRKIHDHCQDICKPGITTQEIDDEAGRLFEKYGVRGLFKNYPTYRKGEGFPSNLCISVNEVVVHGIASDYKIKDGDIVGIDCGVQLDGWCADAAQTIMVGNVSPEARRLCEVTQEVLQLAIDNIKPGRKWSQIARLMQAHAEQAGLGVVKDFVGHGIGRCHHPGGWLDGTDCGWQAFGAF